MKSHHKLCRLIDLNVELHLFFDYVNFGILQILVIYYLCNILPLQYIVSTIYYLCNIWLRRLASTACPICTEGKHCVSYRAACPMAPFQSPTQCYAHTNMMTQLVTWWRLYEHTLLRWPVSHKSLNLVFILSN